MDECCTACQLREVRRQQARLIEQNAAIMLLQLEILEAIAQGEATAEQLETMRAGLAQRREKLQTLLQS